MTKRFTLNKRRAEIFMGRPSAHRRRADRVLPVQSHAPQPSRSHRQRRREGRRPPRAARPPGRWIKVFRLALGGQRPIIELEIGEIRPRILCRDAKRGEGFELRPSASNKPDQRLPPQPGFRKERFHARDGVVAVEEIAYQSPPGEAASFQRSYFRKRRRAFDRHQQCFTRPVVLEAVGFGAPL